MEVSFRVNASDKHLQLKSNNGFKPGGGASRSNREPFSSKRRFRPGSFPRFISPCRKYQKLIFFSKIIKRFWNEDKKKKLMKNYIVIQLCTLLTVTCEIISGPSDFAAGIKEQGILSCIATKQGGNPGEFFVLKSRNLNTGLNLTVSFWNKIRGLLQGFSTVTFRSNLIASRDKISTSWNKNHNKVLY